MNSYTGTFSTFFYDYRSRRYYRDTTGANAETTYHVFDGGLSIQEYDATSNPTPQTSNLLTEFIRGEGMGGGVGGMVYSIKNGNIICSHANHRGDVIARTDHTGSLTSFALYEAYGTRPYEWGEDPDRQKANTKEEESDLNLLNEGMRFRDLETGVFLTRDPIGYGDGPNVYCYVSCNPIVNFDPLGLWEDDGDGGLNWDGHLNVYDPKETIDGEASRGRQVDYRDMEKMIEGAEDGYVTLPNGSKIRVEAMQQAFNINNEILESTAKHKDDRWAHQALTDDGYMSSLDAALIESQVLENGGVVSKGEHWNARYVLNDENDLRNMYRIYKKQFNSREASSINFLYEKETWSLVPKAFSKFHGEGCKKWVSNDGRELVITVDGVIETSPEKRGTYNFGGHNLGFGEHYNNDVDPYNKPPQAWGNNPFESNFNEHTKK